MEMLCQTLKMLFIISALLPMIPQQRASHDFDQAVCQGCGSRILLFHHSESDSGVTGGLAGTQMQGKMLRHESKSLMI